MSTSSIEFLCVLRVGQENIAKMKDVKKEREQFLLRNTDWRFVFGGKSH